MVKPTASVELSGLAESGVLTTDRFGSPYTSLFRSLVGEALVGVAVAVLFSVPLKPEAVVPPTWKTTLVPAAMLPMVSLNVLPLSDGVPAVPVPSVALVQATPVGAGSGSLRTTP